MKSFSHSLVHASNVQHIREATGSFLSLLLCSICCNVSFEDIPVKWNEQAIIVWVLPGGLRGLFCGTTELKETETIIREVSQKSIFFSSKNHLAATSPFINKPKMDSVINQDFHPFA